MALNEYYFIFSVDLIKKMLLVLCRSLLLPHFIGINSSVFIRRLTQRGCIRSRIWSDTVGIRLRKQSSTVLYSELHFSTDDFQRGLL